jgi:hypothetical protein
MVQLDEKQSVVVNKKLEENILILDRELGVEKSLLCKELFAFWQKEKPEKIRFILDKVNCP